MKTQTRVPSAVAYLVILLVVLGLHRFTTLGIDDAPSRTPLPSDGAGAPPDESITSIALVPSHRSEAHLLAPLRLEGHELLFLLDTGASSSVMSRRAARALGLEERTRPVLGAVNESWQLQQVLPVDSLELGTARFSDFELVVMDLSPIRAGLGREVAGVLGANVLGAQPFEIDFPRRRLWLGRSEAAFERDRGADQRDGQLPLRGISGGYFVTAAAESMEAWFLVDSGASQTQIGEALASRVGDRSSRLGRSYDAVDTRFEPLMEARLGSLMVGQLTRSGVQVSVGEPTLLGLDFLADLHLRIDPGEQRLTLRYTPPVR
jgi:predicted aspartyl protease